jgi:prepilin-type N-terminal cleavage/methylation domain-containing protein
MIISRKLYDFSAATIVEKEVSNMSQLMKKVAKGFTLIELMIVVAIIGILAAIAIPKFADLVTKSKEASIKGSLGTIRSAVSIYYSDQEGVYPASGSLAIALTSGSRYLQEMPYVQIPQGAYGHSRVNTETTVNADGGNWLYAPGSGQVAVNCTHTDTKSSTWSTW